MCRRLLRICYILIFLTLHLSAEETGNLPFAEVEGDPSAIVAGCVNVITGSYSTVELDLILPGPEPLSFERAYWSGDSARADLKNAWRINHSWKAHLTTDSATIPESSGGSLTYHMPSTKAHDFPRDNSGNQYGPERRPMLPSKITHYVSPNTKFLKGLTNTGSSHIAGCTNLLNQTVTYYPRESCCEVKLCNGGMKLFKTDQTTSAIPRNCLLQKEERANGNQFLYEYQNKELTRIIATNRSGQRTYGTLTLDYSQFVGNQPKITLIASDGRQVLYQFLPIAGKGYYLGAVTRPDAPFETYQYGGPHGTQVTRKERFDRRFQEISYYVGGSNQVGDAVLWLKPNREDSKYIGMVSLLKAPVGTDDQPIITHRFIYSFNVDKHNYTKYYEGRTDVYNAYNRLTQYFFNREHRLEQIFHHTRTAGLSSKEHFYWGAVPGRHCDLVCKALEQPDGTVRSCRFLEYDDKHNVLAEHILGNLSGTSTITPLLNWDGTPQSNGAECYTVRHTYSNDRFNLHLSETLPTGRHIQYKYLPETDLLEATLIGNGQEVLSRTFHTYDSNASLIKTITDDGLSQNSNDLTNVTYRKITYFNPKADCPCMGLPDQIHECYLDINTGAEQLLNRKINTYSIEGRLTHQEHYDTANTLRYCLRWEYDPMGNVICEQNALGQIITRTFDPNRNRTSEQGPNPGYRTDYTYDFSNRLIAEEIVCTDGQRFKQSYRYDYLGNRTASIDHFGHETTYDYDDFGRLIRTTLPPTVDQDGNLVQYKTTQEYDIAGNIIKTTDANGDATRKTYNIRGQATQITHPDGTTEQYAYNLDGSLHQQTTQNGTTTTFQYDTLGNIIRKDIYSATGEHLTTTSATYKGKQLIAETDANGNLTTYHYDGAGRLLKVAKANTWTRYEYDNLGRKYKTIEGIGPSDTDVRVTIIEYDLLDRSIEERIEDGTDKIFTRVLTQYDSSGNRCATTTFTDAGPAITKILYNAQGKPWKTIDAEGHETVTHYDYNYCNALGQRVLKVVAIDPLGNQTETIHDTLGRQTTTIRKNAFGNESARTHHHYDGAGRQVRRTDVICIANTPTREMITEWQYDRAGRLTALFEAVGTAQARQTHYSYNSYGEKITDIFADGTMLHYRYDPLGRLAHYTASDRSIAYRYTYDLNGNILSFDDEVDGTTTTRTYNPLSQLKSETLSNGLSLNYTYDNIGRVTKLELPDNSAVQYHYNAAFLTDITRSDASGIARYSHHYLKHDQSGHITTAQLIGNAGLVTTTRDKLFRVTHLYSTHFEEQVPEGGYDAAGNLLKKYRRDSNGQITCRYQWDSLYQLSQESHVQRSPACPQAVLQRPPESSSPSTSCPQAVSTSSPIPDSSTTTTNYPLKLLLTKSCSFHDLNHQYTYDSLNNRLSIDNAECHLDALNQLLQQGSNSYTYDPKGNRITKRTLSSQHRYTYDALGRLITVTTERYHYEYRYDSFNRRVSKTIYDLIGTPLDHENYLYYGQMEIGAIRNNTLTQLRVLGTGLGAEIGAAVAIELNGTPYAPLHDQSGHVVALVDPTNNTIADTYRYSAFGEELHAPSLANPWRYASKRHDLESNLINFGRRYYDSEVGRWLTPDPRGFDDGPNLYAYVHNSPLTHFDPWGLWTSGKHDKTENHCWNIGSGFLNGTLHPIDTWNRFEGYVGKLGRCIGCGNFSEIRDSWNRLESNEKDRFIGNRAGEIGAGVAVLSEVAALGAATLVKQALQKVAAYRASFKSASLEGIASQEARSIISYESERVINETVIVAEQQATIGGFLGKRGWQLKNAPYQSTRNSSATINNREFSGHALDQMQNRGISPSIVEQTIKNGTRRAGDTAGTVEYFDSINNVIAITNSENGRVVTTYFFKQGTRK